jgi:hypothetical protein
VKLVVDASVAVAASVTPVGFTPRHASSRLTRLRRATARFGFVIGPTEL